jgi:hypothetical protein
VVAGVNMRLWSCPLYRHERIQLWSQLSTLNLPICIRDMLALRQWCDIRVCVFFVFDVCICIYIWFTVYHKHGHPLRKKLETLNRLNSERCMKVFALVAQFTFQPSRTYAQYDLAALVSIPNIDETMTDALASVDKNMYPSVASRELAGTLFG